MQFATRCTEGYERKYSHVCCVVGFSEGMKRYKKAMIRKRRNQKEIPTPKAEVGKYIDN